MAKLFVIAAPSGTGKTSLIKGLLKSNSRDNLKLGISFTTRTKRKNETEGKDYFFISKEEFQEKLQQNNLLEHANVFGNLYGTGKKWVNEQTRKGTNLILELDFQGALQVKDLYAEAILIFILPPSLQDLKTRLEERALDSPEVINNRLKEAKKEIDHSQKFNFTLVNQEFNESLKDLEDIIINNLMLSEAKIKLAQKTLKFLVEEGERIE